MSPIVLHNITSEILNKICSLRSVGLSGIKCAAKQQQKRISFYTVAGVQKDMVNDNHTLEKLQSTIEWIHRHRCFSTTGQCIFRLMTLYATYFYAMTMITLPVHK